MLLIPAIDLKDGKCVRLLQGREEKQTIYSDNPIRQALVFQEVLPGFSNPVRVLRAISVRIVFHFQ